MKQQNRPYEAIFLEKVKDFIADRTLSEQGKIAAQVEMMRLGRFDVVHTKIIKRPAQELIAGKYRLIFFIDKHNIYFVFAFVKKTQKTPKQYIEISKEIYKRIINENSKDK